MATTAITRRDFLRTAAATSAGVAAASAPGSAAAKPGREGPVRRRPNILFFFTDDQRADTIHALGNQAIITPNLDRLAKRGFVFNNTYCLGANSGAVCLPSRNMLLSGRAYFRFAGTLGRRKRMYASPDKPNLPDALRAAGYETYHHGKRGNTARLIHKRFDHTKYVEHHNRLRNGEPGKVVVDDAISFLKSRKRRKPFFLYLAISEPHDLRIPARKYLDRYRREDIPLPANYMPLHPFNNGEMTIRDERLEAWPRTKEAIRRHIHEYYGMITGLDHHFGRLVRTLKELGQYDDTVILFSSDNGLAIGSHGLMGKQSVYEHSGKVPFVLAGPGIPRGRSDALVYLMDIFPTLCGLVGVPIPGGLDGRSVVPVIRGKASGVRDTLLSSYRACQRAVRDARWKLIRYPLINRTQLFDLRDDPHEMRDLAGEASQAGRIEKMTAALRQWQKTLGDKQALSSKRPAKAEWSPPQSRASSQQG